MNIKEELDPYIEHITDEIASMGVFEKDRVKTLLLIWFGETIEQVYNLRAENLAGLAINNQRSIEFDGLSARDRLFIQSQNTFLKEQRKESRRTANLGKEIKEYAALRAAVNNKLGHGAAIRLLQEAGL